jgi:Zn-dependent peptidase ImmA (M78 family)
MGLKDRYILSRDAISLRLKLNESADSSIDIFNTLKNLKNVTLVFHPFSSQISGMCIKAESHFLIAINSSTTIGRQRFTAAHELYHTYLQDGFSSVVCEANLEDNKKNDEEKNADLFASYFLAPVESLQMFIEKLLNGRKNLELKDILSIEQYFQISRQANLVRLISEGYLSRAEAEHFKKNIIIEALKLGFDISLYKPSSPENSNLTFGSYIFLAQNLLDSGKISNAAFKEYLLQAFRPDLVDNAFRIEENIYD